MGLSLTSHTNRFKIHHVSLVNFPPLGIFCVSVHSASRYFLLTVLSTFRCFLPSSSFCLLVFLFSGIFGPMVFLLCGIFSHLNFYLQVFSAFLHSALQFFAFRASDFGHSPIVAVQIVLFLMYKDGVRYLFLTQVSIFTRRSL